MKWLVILCYILVCFPVSARQIVLLTSLPLKDHQEALKAERFFLRETKDFAHEYVIKVQHQADQETLFYYLNHPETHALFWLSHGAFRPSRSNTGVRATPMLLDHQGDNVASVFRRIHPDVRFVGVIGCNTAQILDQHIQARELLDYFIPAKKVIGQISLKRAVRNFRYTHFRKDNLTRIPEVPAPTLSVTVQRRSGNDLPIYKSLKVFVGTELVTVLPKMGPDQREKFELLIPHRPGLGRRDLKIVFDSGQNPLDERDHIGELKLSFEGSYPWRLFGRSDGRPFGTNERIFHFMGEL
jgi:hypothetical protein